MTEMAFLGRWLAFLQYDNSNGLPSENFGVFKVNYNQDEIYIYNKDSS